MGRGVSMPSDRVYLFIFIAIVAMAYLIGVSCDE